MARAAEAIGTRKMEAKELKVDTTETLVAAYKREGGGALSLLRELLANPDSNASQALRSRGISASKLHSSLLGTGGVARAHQFLGYGAHVTNKLVPDCRRFEGNPLMTTLHILIAILRFEPECGAAQVLRKLGVRWEELVEFAQTAATEP